MTFIATMVFVVAASAIGWWWFVARNQPAYPPLDIAEGDPLMEDAKAKSRSSIPQFLRHLVSNPHSGKVKIPFVSSSGNTEYLWAEVQSVEGGVLNVLYLTPPVTHTGRLERLHRHAVSDLVDWVVELPDGTYAGGYTMRVMFKRGREQWGSLPPELEAEERKYVAV